VPAAFGSKSKNIKAIAGEAIVRLTVSSRRYPDPISNLPQEFYCDFSPHVHFLAMSYSRKTFCKMSKEISDKKPERESGGGDLSVLNFPLVFGEAPVE